MTETEHLTLFIYALCCLSAFVSLWCVAWGLFHLFGDKTAEKGSFKDVEFDNPRDYERPSWVCDRCKDIQPGSDTPHHFPPNYVCYDCYEVEQDARREGREDDRTGYQRRDGF